MSNWKQMSIQEGLDFLYKNTRAEHYILSSLKYNFGIEAKFEDLQIKEFSARSCEIEAFSRNSLKFEALLIFEVAGRRFFYAQLDSSRWFVGELFEIQGIDEYKESEQMKPIEEVYPDCNYFCDYQPLLESYGYKILLQVDDDDYQGDSRLIFQDGTRYGLLIFGWGSCSGCDALQACSSYKEVEELRQELHGEIRWFTASELLDYCKTHDW